MSKLVLSLLIAVCALRAADNELPPASAGPVTTAAPALKVPGKNLWRISIAAFAAAEILDAQSSWGKRELNPNLSSSGDTFGAKGALIKFGILGGVTGIEYLVLHHAPSKGLYRVLTLINFGAASVTGAVAGHNYTVAYP